MFILIEVLQNQNIVLHLPINKSQNIYLLTKSNIMKSQQIANYIMNLSKSVGKDLNYALSIVEWYSATDKQDKEVKLILNQIWN
jgi:hypothetical protein